MAQNQNQNDDRTQLRNPAEVNRETPYTTPNQDETPRQTQQDMRDMDKVGYEQNGGQNETDSYHENRDRNNTPRSAARDDLNQTNEMDQRARNEGNMPGNEADIDPENPNRNPGGGNMPGNRDEDNEGLPEGEDLPGDPNDPPTSEEGPWTNDPPEYGDFQPDPPNRPGEGETNPLRMGDGQNPKTPTPQGTAQPGNPTGGIPPQGW